MMIKARIVIGILSALILLSGCGTPRQGSPGAQRPFVFGEDTFAYANELVWDYFTDPETGKWSHKRHVPKPDYTHHCFVVVRAAKEFFRHARFDPAAPRVDAKSYKKLIKQVIARDPRKVSPPEKRVVIPGYTNLYQFSLDYEKPLKAHCGGAWQSYLQRGHWRSVHPFTRGGQAKTAERLTNILTARQPVVIHIVQFPSLRVNHALLIYEAKQTAQGLEFSAYDPNHPEGPRPLTYDTSKRQFFYGQNPYFIGGTVDVYEIYSCICL